MNTSALIAMLEEIPGDPEVLIFDPDAEEWLGVRSCTYDAQAINLYCDED